MSVEDINKNRPHYSVLAMCVDQRYEGIQYGICGHLWFEIIMAGTNLSTLECPKCGSQKSFVSFISTDFDPTGEDE